MHEHGVSRDTVERAFSLLRSEGLIVVERLGTRVREPEPPTILRLSRGKVSARIPTEPERRLHGIREGAALLAVTHDENREEIYPADEVEIWIVPAHPQVPDGMAG